MEIYACVYFPDASSVLSASKPWKTDRPLPRSAHGASSRAGGRQQGSAQHGCEV